MVNVELAAFRRSKEWQLKINIKVVSCVTLDPMRKFSRQASPLKSLKFLEQAKIMSITLDTKRLVFGFN